MLWRLRSFPDFCESCLPSPVERPPAGSEWVHEIKHDGFRLLRRRGASGVRLFTRNGNDWTERFPLIVEALSALKVATCLFDGEAAPANGCLAGITLLALASNAQAQFGEQKAIDWRTFEVRDFGTSIQYPASIFSPAGQLERGLGKRFERADGRAVLSIYARPNEAGENPKTYLKKNLRVDRSALDYVRIARSFFAISSERDGVILYSRCNFSGGARGVIHCFDVKYPQQEKRAWDAVVTRISFDPLKAKGLPDVPAPISYINTATLSRTYDCERSESVGTSVIVSRMRGFVAVGRK